MNSKRKLVAAVLLLSVFSLALFFWLKPVRTTAVAPTPAVQAPMKTLPDGRPAPVDPNAAMRGAKENFGPDTNAMLAFAAAMMKPFELVGQVVDQNGEPVAAAAVDWGANNNPDPNASGTRGTTTTDSSGMFIVRSHGLDVYARASKEGYATFYSDNRKKVRGSDGGYKNGGFLGNTDLPMGNKNAPAILVLRKMGETVPLIHIAERSVQTPKNGSPVGVDLETGQTSSQGDLKVQCWTNDQTENAQGHYDWRCHLTVTGGGLIERNDNTVFEAPATGYQESVELTPSPEKWASKIERQYFVKLSDGRYAWINFRMRTGGEHFFVIESSLNPTPGDRNLEFDPAKVVKSP